MNSILKKLILGLTVFAATSTGSPSLADGIDAAARFSLVLQQSFSTWDSNRDGYLTSDELDIALQDPANKADRAAALAALKIFSRTAWQDDSVAKYFRYDELYQQDTSNGNSKSISKLAGLFDGYCKKIGKSSPALFASGMPHIEDIRQGRSGDCYFLSTVGGMAYHTPQRVINMIAANSDGSYTVTFPRHKPIIVAAPTDAEIACYSDAGEDGMWLHVIEKAYAIFKKNKTHKQVAEPLDLVIHGGSGARMLMFMTGNGCTRYPTSTTTLSELRNQLVDALSHHRIVNTGTKGHCLTILKYDATTDYVTVWNPWGSSGLYKTVNQQMNHGVFAMPLTDLQKYFVSILPELSRPWTVADFNKFK